ncbi:hypothetical protein QA646_21350 (plasmid) [Rhizobium sp. CB3090]|uniref:hypothetical protein n=1 Tax=Rhizobium sp. CB3090 TaxID=3039156 RepID=UPI0024B10DA0|nr:hypothetical protein [Rhizobium sp. CB3090]WFU12452.1 hypothetical protein QA646_21350 [Rhizobium sp. CB3090]
MTDIVNVTANVSSRINVMRIAAAITLTVLPRTNSMARSAPPSFYNLLTGSRMRPHAEALAVGGRWVISE